MGVIACTLLNRTVSGIHSFFLSLFHLQVIHTIFWYILIAGYPFFSPLSLDSPGYIFISSILNVQYSHFLIQFLY